MENKGFTLVELIISIALISIVVMFLFNLLTDVKASNNNTDFTIVYTIGISYTSCIKSCGIRLFF